MDNKKSDNELCRQVRSLLEKDKNLRGYALNADVIEGEVQLQGIVDTLSEKEWAEKLVRQVPGVKGVSNAISISTDGGLRNEEVTREVQEELDIDPDVDLRHIGAESVGGNGTVVLKGRTDDPAEIEAARAAASKARGVTKVISQVELTDLTDEEPGLEDIFHSQVNNDEEK